MHREIREQKLGDHSFEIVSKYRDGDVDQQTHSDFAQAKIGKKLGFMNRKNFLHRLDFKNELARKEKVHDQIIAKNPPLVSQGNPGLGLARETSQTEILLKTFLINRFQQPGPPVRMDLKCRPNYGVSQWIFHFHFILFCILYAPSVSWCLCGSNLLLIPLSTIFDPG